MRNWRPPRDRGTIAGAGPSQRTTTANNHRAQSGTDRTGAGKGRNAEVIWQDLVDDHGFAGGYRKAL